MKKVVVFMVFAAVCLGRLGPSDETCCPTRYMAMMPISMPPGQVQDLDSYYRGAALKPLIGDALDSMDTSCPEIMFPSLDAKSAADDLSWKVGEALRKEKGLPPDPSGWKPSPPETDMDYVLRGTLTADQMTGKDRSGNLEGKFSFRLRLVDHHHGDAVVKEGSTSWNGSITDGLEEVESLGSSFCPLPPLLKGYERIAEKTSIEVPNDKVEAGHTETITLSELYDKDGRQTQEWQRLFIHIEKGKILNAKQVVDAHQKRYHIFRADGGRVEIRYQAPDECKTDRETLTVFNCCEKNEPPAGLNLHPKKEIGKKEFDIVCDRWNVELTFTKTMSGKEQLGEGGMTRQVGGSYSATVKAVVEYVKSQGSDRIFESKSAELDLNDTFWQHLVLQTGDLTCEGRISWTGTHNGKIQVPVIMKIHTRAKQCSFGFGRPGGDPIIYKMAVNLWGDDRCGGARAWNGESPVKDVLFSASGVDVEHLPKPIPFSPGQKEVSGQDKWNSTLWLVRSWGAMSVPMEQFPALWRPMLGLLKASSLISKKIPANMTLSWKATKLGQKD